MPWARRSRFHSVRRCTAIVSAVPPAWPPLHFRAILIALPPRRAARRHTLPGASSRPVDTIATGFSHADATSQQRCLRHELAARPISRQASDIDSSLVPTPAPYISAPRANRLFMPRRMPIRPPVFYYCNIREVYAAQLSPPKEDMPYASAIRLRAAIDMLAEPLLPQGAHLRLEIKSTKTSDDIMRASAHAAEQHHTIKAPPAIIATYKPTDYSHARHAIA